MTATPDPRNPRTLRRELGLVDAVAVGLGAMVGAGIFVVLGLATAVAGEGIFLALLLAGVVAACNALSSAELAARYPSSGGSYEYGYQLLHPAAGFLAGWLFLTSKLAAAGAVALGFGQYVRSSAGLENLPPQAVAIVALVLLTIANLAGIQKAGKLNLAVVAVTLGSLLIFVVAGAPRAEPVPMAALGSASFGSVMGASAMIFFAFTGYARIATLAEEVREPKRTIPRAIAISLAVATLLYLAVAAVSIGLLGAEGVGSSKTPLVSAAEVVGQGWVAQAVAVGAATSMLGVLLSQILGISRMMLAMARRRDLPATFQHVSERAVPARSVLATALVILLLVLFGTLEAIVATAALAILVYYTVANLAALRLVPADKLMPRWVAILGLLGCLSLAASLRPETLATGLAVTGVGFAWRAWLHRNRKPDAARYSP